MFSPAVEGKGRAAAASGGVPKPTRCALAEQIDAISSGIIALQIPPTAIEKSYKKTVKSVDETIQNLEMLDSLLPNDLGGEGLVDKLKSIRKALGELKTASLSEVLTQIKDSKQQLKSSIKEIHTRLIAWEGKLLQNALFSFEHESPLSLIYGKKHARIIELAEIVSKIPMKDVHVPIPKGLQRKDIERFLQKYAPEIPRLWQELGSLSRRDSFSFSRPDVQEKLNAIQKMIEEAFIKAATDDEAFTLLSFDRAYLQWLDEMRASGDYLIVRSSAAEDAMKSANAGGNETVHYVRPNRDELCRALGKVLASCVGAGSLQNRLQAGEKELFSTSPIFGVTTQTMIGEPIGGAKDPNDIPISIVLFTNEPLYVGNEPFRIMRISASFGNGEGVVNAAGIKTDTYLVLRSLKHPDRLYILENNQVKPRRLAPQQAVGGKVELVKMQNPTILAERPTLDHTTLARLFYLGVVVEMMYGGSPTDMELVIRQGKIYPLQARPIHRPQATPTYLDLRKVPQGASKESYQFETFLPGNGAMQLITSPDQVLVRASLAIAEKQYKKSEHTLVIVPNEEHDNTHPEVNLSDMGVPVMFTEAPDVAQKFINKASATTPLLACLQSGQSLLVDASLCPDPSACATPGYVVHPANIAISVQASALPALPQAPSHHVLPQEIKHLLMQCQADAGQEVALQAIAQLKREVIELKKKRYQLVTLLQGAKVPPVRGEQLVGAISALTTTYRCALSELKALVTSQSQAPLQRLHQLFYTKVIQRLFTQEENPQALGRFSIMSVDPELQAVQSMVNYQSELIKLLGQQPRFRSIIAHITAQFTEEVLDGAYLRPMKEEENWIDFLQSIEWFSLEKSITHDEVVSFKEMLSLLRKLNLTELWMEHFYLPRRYTVMKLDLFRHVVREFNQETKALLEEMHETLGDINALKDLVDGFQEPSLFEGSFTELRGLLEKFISPDNRFKERLEVTYPLAHVATYQIMKAFVDLFDTAIKRLKASPLFSQEKKVELFKRMVGLYLQLMENWTRGFAASLLQYHDAWPLETYLREVRSLFNSLPATADQLRPSQNFDVSFAQLGKRGDLEGKMPATLEDLFTLIHQNLLAVIAQLVARQMSVSEALLPRELIEAQAICKKLPVQLVGLEVLQDSIELHYNYPMNVHSATFDIRYDKKSRECSLHIYFTSDDHDWEEIRNAVILLDEARVLRLKAEPYMTGVRLEYTLQLANAEEMNLAFAELQRYADFSLRNSVTLEDCAHLPGNIFCRIAQNRGIAKAVELATKHTWRGFIRSCQTFIQNGGIEPITAQKPVPEQLQLILDKATSESSTSKSSIDLALLLVARNPSLDAAAVASVDSRLQAHVSRSDPLFVDIYRSLLMLGEKANAAIFYAKWHPHLRGETADQMATCKAFETKMQQLFSEKRLAEARLYGKSDEILAREWNRRIGESCEGYRPAIPHEVVLDAFFALVLVEGASFAHEFRCDFGPHICARLMGSRVDEIVSLLRAKKYNEAREAIHLFLPQTPQFDAFFNSCSL